MSIYNTETNEETYFGCVMELGEHNYYDDSDFYAIVWDEEEQTFKSVEYATTRCYCYHIGANIDASEDLKFAWHLWRKHADRVQSVKERWKRRIELIGLAKECRVENYLQLKDLARAYDSEKFKSCIKLLKTKKFRSSFRESLCTQLRNWLETPFEAREHSRPFSPRQADFI